MKKLENRVAIVTGATAGIGEAIARLYAKNGANVVLAGRNEKRGQEIEKSINSNKEGQAMFVQCDVTSEEDIKQLVSKTIAKYNKIDILVNNAGVMLPSMEVERMPVEDWKKTFDININGMFLMCKYVKPYILESKGVILNNASIAGLQYYAAGRSYAYSASKAAVIQFSHQMAMNYGEEGVRVNTICPGIIDTEILGDRDRSIYAERVPLRRIGMPEDVAKVALFLVSDDAAYLTGVVIPIDGGVSL